MFAALRNECRIVPLQSPFNTEHEVRFSVSPYTNFKCIKNIKNVVSLLKLKLSMLSLQTVPNFNAWFLLSVLIFNIIRLH